MRDPIQVIGITRGAEAVSFVECLQVLLRSERTAGASESVLKVDEHDPQELMTEPLAPVVGAYHHAPDVRDLVTGRWNDPCIRHKAHVGLAAQQVKGVEVQVIHVGVGASLFYDEHVGPQCEHRMDVRRAERVERGQGPLHGHQVTGCEPPSIKYQISPVTGVPSMERITSR